MVSKTNFMGRCKLAWSLPLLTGASLARFNSAMAGTPKYPNPDLPVDVRVDSNGVQAVGCHFADDCAKPTPWQGRWIWTDAQPSPLAAMFRKVVVLDAPFAK